MEIKNLRYKIADIDNKKRVVKAYYSSFNNVDDVNDILLPGALTKSHIESGPNGRDKIKHFCNHDCFLQNDEGKILGYNNSAIPLGKVLELGTDSHGGYFVSKIARTQKAQDIYTMYEDGLINDHSFTYEVIKSKNRPDGVRELWEVKVLEVSTVTLWPANDHTYTIDVKTAARYGTGKHKYESLFTEPSRISLIDKADFKQLIKKFDYSLLKF